MKKRILLTPGPASVPSNIAKASLKQLIHHRGEEHKKLYSFCRNEILDLIKSKDDYLAIIPSTGTGALQMIVSSLFSAGQEVILISIGFFGDYWANILKKHKVKVHSINYKRGHTYKIEDVEKALIKHKKAKAIFVTHSETSSGILNKLQPLGKLTKKHKKLLCVDSISGLIMNEFEFSKWNIDAVAFASQKGFMMNPGLAFCAMSKKAVAIAKKTTNTNYYLDFLNYDKFAKEASMVPATAPVSLFFELEEALKTIKKISLSKLQDEKYENRIKVQEGLKNLGFTMFADPKYQGNSTLAFYHEDIKDNTNYLEYLKKRGIQIAPGIPPIKKQYMRIGFLTLVKPIHIKKLLWLSKKYLKKYKG